MARIKSPEKRSAILQAAVREIAEVGLGAPTAKIARRAGLATGTLFTYFANKEKLLNELYLELKIEVYRRVNTNFPGKANLERRARHVWSSSLDWAIVFPEKRKVSVLLNVSDLITLEMLVILPRGAVLTARHRAGSRFAYYFPKRYRS
jgi:AcrR family transcriptional regulator